MSEADPVDLRKTILEGRLQAKDYRLRDFPWHDSKQDIPWATLMAAIAAAGMGIDDTATGCVFDQLESTEQFRQRRTKGTQFGLLRAFPVEGWIGLEDSGIVQPDYMLLFRFAKHSLPLKGGVAVGYTWVYILTVSEDKDHEAFDYFFQLDRFNDYILAYRLMRHTHVVTPRTGKELPDVLHESAAVWGKNGDREQCDLRRVEGFRNDSVERWAGRALSPATCHLGDPLSRMPRYANAITDDQRLAFVIESGEDCIDALCNARFFEAVVRPSEFVEACVRYFLDLTKALPGEHEISSWTGIYRPDCPQKTLLGMLVARLGITIPYLEQWQDNARIPRNRCMHGTMKPDARQAHEAVGLSLLLVHDLCSAGELRHLGQASALRTLWLMYRHLFPEPATLIQKAIRPRA